MLFARTRSARRADYPPSLDRPLSSNVLVVTVPGDQQIEYRVADSEGGRHYAAQWIGILGATIRTVALADLPPGPSILRPPGLRRDVF